MVFQPQARVTWSIFQILRPYSLDFDVLLNIWQVLEVSHIQIKSCRILTRVQLFGHSIQCDLNGLGNRQTILAIHITAIIPMDMDHTESLLCASASLQRGILHGDLPVGDHEIRSPIVESWTMFEGQIEQESSIQHLQCPFS